MNRITKEAGDFAPGTRIVVFPMDGHSLGTFICYESAFPAEVREFVKRGAQLLVNLSNDGYFGKSAAREQHLAIARMRAAENRRWVLRATNDGITAAIDPAGRVVERWPMYQEVVRRMAFQLLNRHDAIHAIRRLVRLGMLLAGRYSIILVATPPLHPAQSSERAKPSLTVGVQLAPTEPRP